MTKVPTTVLGARRRGRPAIDDTAALLDMRQLLESDSATNPWAAAQIVARRLISHSYEAAVWRLYKKFRRSVGHIGCNSPPELTGSSCVGVEGARDA